MPPGSMEMLADAIAHSGRLLIGMADSIAYDARKAGARPRRPRGFQVLKDWDGSGVITDRRWRGGRPRKQGESPALLSPTKGRAR
jgi:hypothetical protein